MKNQVINIPENSQAAVVIKAMMERKKYVQKLVREGKFDELKLNGIKLGKAL
ncbi:hypothetical protein [Solitalea lacus]|uniref:hypothetical protein n=1 Tax=Solitalea lacus TaxID=2911172 RepID=UPI001EDBA65E|nr:hypothetical protein [Solitalea lacus]UKJ09073.1 hypothetical protein L2B55_07875 [Solitalea lacus]